MNRLVILVIIFSIPILFFGYSNASRTTTATMLDSSIQIMSNSGQIQEIREIVYEFLELRSIKNQDELHMRASLLDEKIRNVDLISQNCEKPISTIELIQSKDPYQLLQSKCSKLGQISFSKAYEVWKIFT